MEKRQGEYNASAVITIYSGSIRNRGDSYYVEIQNISQDKNGKDHRGAARPITREALGKLISLVNLKNDDGFIKSKIIPECLLSFNPEKGKRKIVWWKKPGYIDMVFSEKTKIPNGLIHLPSLLFVMDGKLRIFSMKGSKRPNLNTSLCHAPILNYYDNNSLCWGSVNVEVPDGLMIDEEMNFWEDKLWNSEFSHAGGYTTTKTDIMKLYRKLVNTDKRFPAGELIETTLKLSDVI
jgi:PRTRC genetic system protein B